MAVSKDMCGSVKKGSGAHPERTCAQSVEIDVTWKASSPKVVVVVPTYNEVANLDKLVQRISDLDIQNLKILFVDDGSPDGTGEAVERLAKKYEGLISLIQRGRKLGLGTAYVTGFSQALIGGADYVLQMDADLSHSPEAIPAFIEKLSGADVVVGSRYVEDGSVDDTWGISRRALSYFGNLGIRMITGLKVRDATSGFKAFRFSALQNLNLNGFRSGGFAFQAEMAHACQRKGYRVVEHPIIFKNRSQGHSKMSALIVIEAIWKLLPLRWSPNP